MLWLYYKKRLYAAVGRNYKTIPRRTASLKLDNKNKRIMPLRLDQETTRLVAAAGYKDARVFEIVNNKYIKIHIYCIKRYSDSDRDRGMG